MEGKIQQYLDGTLDSEERSVFESRLKTDPELQKQLEKYKLLLDGIRYQARKEGWEKITDLEEEYEGKSIDKRVTINDWRYVAACFIGILFTALLVYILLSKPDSLQDLYAENFAPYPALTHGPLRGADPGVSLEERAYAAYSNENYDEAIILFMNLLNEKEDPLVLFYLGNAYLANEEYGNATTVFEQALEQNIVIDNQTRWYLALSYMAQGRKEEAIIQLKELARGSSSYSYKAQTIIQQL